MGRTKEVSIGEIEAGLRRLGANHEPPRGWEARVLLHALGALSGAYVLTFFDHDGEGGMPGAEDAVTAWATERGLTIEPFLIRGPGPFVRMIRVQNAGQRIEVYCDGSRVPT